MNVNHLFCVAKTRFIYAKQLSRSLGEAKTRFISPLGEIFIDEVNKGLRSNQTAVSSSRKAKLKNFQAA
ncbi:MAG: hypothetical protein J6T41_06405 [Neisseriaceae bacterium]|nr:hypothetical protein [Neisseriaceae bacterium]